MVAHYLAALGLKDTARTGWQLRGVLAPESVADHSWGTAYLCMLYASRAGVDAAKAVGMAVIHDLAEALTGDVAMRVAILDDGTAAERKRLAETTAMASLCSLLPDEEALRVTGLWREYEQARTAEAAFVRDMNLIDMCAQAYRYEAGGRYDPRGGSERFPDYRGVDEFFATSAPRLATEVGRRLFAELLGLYDRLPGVASRGGARLDPRAGEGG